MAYDFPPNNYLFNIYIILHKYDIINKSKMFFISISGGS